MVNGLRKSMNTMYLCEFIKMVSGNRKRLLIFKFMYIVIT